MWKKKHVNLNPDIDECAAMMGIDPAMLKKFTGLENREDSPLLASLPYAKRDYFRETPDIPQEAFRFIDLFCLGYHYAVQASMEEIVGADKPIVMPIVSPVESSHNSNCYYDPETHNIGISTTRIKNAGSSLDDTTCSMHTIISKERSETVGKYQLNSAQSAFLSGVEEARHAIFHELEKTRGIDAKERHDDERKRGVAEYDTTAEKDAEVFVLQAIGDLGLGKAAQPRTNTPDQKYAAKVVKDSRETARKAIKTLLSEGGKTADFIHHLEKRIKESIAKTPEDSEGKRFMTKAAEQMNTADYVSMVYEILMLEKFKQPAHDTLAHYNTWHAKEHSLLPEQLQNDAAIPSNKISRRKAILSGIAAAGFVSLAGGTGIKMLAPEQINEDYKAMINTAIVGGIGTSAGAALAQLMMWDQLTANALIKSVDKELHNHNVSQSSSR